MRFIFWATGIVLCAVHFPRAEAKNIERVETWQSSSVHILRDRTVRIEWSNGESLRLSNLRLVPPTDESAAAEGAVTELAKTPYWTLRRGNFPGNSKHWQKQDPFIELRQWRAGGETLPNVQVVSWTPEGGRRRLLWIMGSNASSSRRTFEHSLMIMSSEITPEGSHQWQASSPAPIPFEYFSQLVGETPSERVQAFDNFQLLSTADPKQGLLLLWNRDEDKIVPVHIFDDGNPDNFRVGNKGIARHIYLPFREHEEQAPEVTVTQPGETLHLSDGQSFPLTSFLPDPKFSWRSHDVFDRRQQARVNFASSPEKALKLLDGVEASTADDPLSAGLHLERWVQRGLQHKLQSNQTYCRVLFLTVPNTLLRYRPEVAQALARQAIEALSNRLDVTEREHITYVRAGAHVEPNRLFAIVDQNVASHFIASRSSRQHIVLDGLRARDYDARDFGRAAYYLTTHYASGGGGRLAVRNEQFFNGLKSALIILAPQGAIDAFSELHSSSGAGVHEFMQESALQFVPRQVRLELLAGMVQDQLRGHLDVSRLDRIISEVEKVSPISPLNDLDQALHNLSVILGNSQIDFEAPEADARIVRDLRKLAGDRRPEPAPEWLLDRAAHIRDHFSINSPSHGSTAFIGRDPQLYRIQEQILRFLNYGSQYDEPFLLLPWLGDNGVGKTKLAQELAVWLKAAYAEVNAATLLKDAADRSAGRSPLEVEGVAAELIRTEADKLALATEPAHVFLVDETHALPGLLRYILPAAGDGDAVRSRRANFDGAIVILAMNNKMEGATAQQLASLSPNHPDYLTVLGANFSESLANMKDRAGVPLDRKIVDAARGRMLGDMTYFPPIGDDPVQQRGVVMATADRYEKRHGMRLILNAHADQILTEHVRRYSSANFRGAVRGARAAFSAAISNTLLQRPDKKSFKDGIYLFQVDKTESGPRYSLSDIGNTPAGLALVVQDTYQRLTRALQGALATRVQKLGEVAVGLSSNDPRRLQLDAYRLMSEAFAISSSRPLFLRPVTARSDAESALLTQTGVKWPAHLDWKQSTALNEFFRERMKELYEAAEADRTFGSPERHEDSERLQKQSALYYSALRRVAIEDDQRHREQRLNNLADVSKSESALPEWIVRGLEIFHEGREAQSAGRQRKFEDDFLLAQLGLWKDSVEARLKDNIQPALVRETTAAFSVQFERARVELLTAHPDLNAARFAKFFGHLIKNELPEAEAMTKPDEAVKAAGNPNLRPELQRIPPDAYGSVAAALFMDQFARQAAEARLKEFLKRPLLEEDASLAARPAACDRVLSVDDPDLGALWKILKKPES